MAFQRPTFRVFWSFTIPSIELRRAGAEVLKRGHGGDEEDNFCIESNGLKPVPNAELKRAGDQVALLVGIFIAISPSPGLPSLHQWSIAACHIETKLLWVKTKQKQQRQTNKAWIFYRHKPFSGSPFSTTTHCPSLPVHSKNQTKHKKEQHRQTQLQTYKHTRYLSILVHHHTIFRPVKNTPTSAYIRDNMVKIGPNRPKLSAGCDGCD